MPHLHLSRSLSIICDRTKLSLSHALAQSVKISVVRRCVSSLSRIISDRFTFPQLSPSIITAPNYWSLSQFEELISSTIENTKDIPEIISETGKVGMPHKGASVIAFHLSVLFHSVLSCLCLIVESEIMKQIGELFLLRTNINLVGSVLDSPVSIRLFHFSH